MKLWTKNFGLNAHSHFFGCFSNEYKKNKQTNKTFAIVPFSLHTSYQILCPKQLQGVADPKKCADIILQTTGLADDAFRLGATKARFQFSRIFFFVLQQSRCC